MNTIKGKEDFYSRQGVTVKKAIRLCKELGLSPSRYLLFAADLLVVMKHY